MENQIQLKGRVFIRLEIHAATGLHIGASDSGIEIGGVDKTVIRDPLTNQPYIPGSSFRGKMRSLLEKYGGLPQNKRIGKGYIHSCSDQKTYDSCDVCQVFGVPGEAEFATPTRLVVRDTPLDPESARRLEQSGHTDLPYTEVKTEVSIDRVTSAANPRQLERVPAGAVFKDAELVFSVYEGSGCRAAKDIERLKTVAKGLQLLEDDYLGGQGSRGSGKVRFRRIRVEARGGDYLSAPALVGEYADVKALTDALTDITAQVKKALAV